MLLPTFWGQGLEGRDLGAQLVYLFYIGHWYYHYPIAGCALFSYTFVNDIPAHTALEFHG